MTEVEIHTERRNRPGTKASVITWIQDHIFLSFVAHYLLLRNTIVGLRNRSKKWIVLQLYSNTFNNLFAKISQLLMTYLKLLILKMKVFGNMSILGKTIYQIYNQSLFLIVSLHSDNSAWNSMDQLSNYRMNVIQTAALR